jgi:hypothetical protein
LLGEGLTNLPTPVNNIEVFENGQSVWREWHWSHDALKSKNELWWDAKDPGRKEREAADKERRRKIEAGLIPDSQLSLKEQFEKAKGNKPRNSTLRPCCAERFAVARNGLKLLATAGRPLKHEKRRRNEA